MADRIVVMNKGHIEQIGSPQEVYDHPATPYVYNFLGNVNQFKSEIQDGEANIDELSVTLKTHETEDGPALAYIRPHDLEIQTSQGNNLSAFAATVQHIHAVGPVVRLELQQSLTNGIIEAEITRERFKELALNQGQQIFVTPKNVRLFSEKTFKQVL